MIKLLSVTIAAASILALTGFRAGDAGRPLRSSITRAMSAVLSPSETVAPPLDPVSRWAEAGSLLVLASGLFGAAVAVNRRR